MREKFISTIETMITITDRLKEIDEMVDNIKALKDTGDKNAAKFDMFVSSVAKDYANGIVSADDAIKKVSQYKDNATSEFDKYCISLGVNQ